MKLIFATNNENKLKELSEAVSKNIEILSLKNVGIIEEIPENMDTIEGNARQKSLHIYKKTGLNCFSDDTGLEITALNGDPGVYSARFAGEKCSYEDNMNKVLELMKGKTDRSAKFRTIISLIIDGKERQFEGKIEGEITEFKKGNKGFGYDPIFRPKGYEKTFAEMALKEKNEISHRGIATKKFINFINSLC